MIIFGRSASYQAGPYASIVSEMPTVFYSDSVKGREA